VAGIRDAAEIARLRRAWVEEQAGSPIEDEDYDAEFAAWFEREAHQRVTWLAEIGDCIIGMLNMLVFTRMPKPRPVGVPQHPRQWGYIANVYVEQADRDAGVGKLLLDAALEYADEHGYVRVVLSPSERSIPFYRRAGFVPASSLLIRPHP
jgi:GNAT superfamily N-acetyltransferase